MNKFYFQKPKMFLFLSLFMCACNDKRPFYFGSANRTELMPADQYKYNIPMGVSGLEPVLSSSGNVNDLDIKVGDEYRELEKLECGKSYKFKDKSDIILSDNIPIKINDKNCGKNNPIIIDGGGVIISGGVKIDGDKFKTDSDVQQKFNLKEGKIFSVSLGEIDSLKSFKGNNLIRASTGFGSPVLPVNPELIVNDEVQTLARYPNSDNSKIGPGFLMGENEVKIIQKGIVPRDYGMSLKDYLSKNKKDKLNFDDKDFPVISFKKANDWRSEPKNGKDIIVAGYPAANWADENIYISKIEDNNITLRSPAIYGYNNVKLYFSNVLSELDKEGEYYIDWESKTLYLYSEKNLEQVKQNNYELTFNSKALMVVENSDNIIIKNITFQNTRNLGVVLKKTNNVQIIDSTFRNIGTTAISIGTGTGSQLNAQNFQFFEEATSAFPELMIDGKFDDTYTIGRLDFGGGPIDNPSYNDADLQRDAGQNNLIYNAHIYNTGAYGVLIAGGTRYGDSFKIGNNHIEQSEIYNTSLVYKQNFSPVSLSGAGNVVKNNKIHDVPHSAIMYIGPNHLIEYNEIYNSLLDSSDAGVIYTGRDPGTLGNVIRYNFLHDNASSTDGQFVFYSDDGGSGQMYYSNLIKNFKGMWILMAHNGIYNHLISNAMDPGVKLGEECFGRTEDIWDEHINRHEIYTSRLNGMLEKGKDYKNFKNALAFRNLNFDDGCQQVSLNNKTVSLPSSVEDLRKMSGLIDGNIQNIGRTLTTPRGSHN